MKAYAKGGRRSPPLGRNQNSDQVHSGSGQGRGSKPLVVLVTTPNRRVSEALSKGLVKSKLAACVNVIPSLRSRYWWKGKVATAKEELLLIKTNQTRLRPLIQWVKDRHPYTVCEVLALSIAAGNKSYLDWIHKSLR